MNTQYPEDEFDEAGKLYPVGAYRQAPSKWKAVLPFLLVLVLAPVLAWGAVSLLTSGTSTPDSTTQNEAQQSSEEKQQPESNEKTTAADQSKDTDESAEKAPENTAADKPAEETKPAEKPVEPANKAANVQVLNGTGVNGLASGAVTKLQAAGFSNLTPDNAVGWQTEVSVVYFKPGNETTAKEVAAALGISTTTESTDSIGDVTVVLKGDYKP